MTIEQEIRNEIDNIKQLKIDVGDINNHLSTLEGLCRERNQKKLDETYQRGLDDAWEAAKKISLMSPNEIEKVFPGAAKYNRYNLGYSGVEAIEKLKAYEEQKADDEIEVGDEVIYNNQKFVVFTLETEEYYASLFDVNGRHVSASQRACKKTGRHFDIEKIMEEMKA